MDTFFEGWHSWACETQRHSPTTGAAPQQSGGAFERGLPISNRAPHGSVFHKLARALDAIVPAQRQGRLLDGDVDELARGRTDPLALGHRLSSRACVEDLDRLGLELPEARAPGHSARGEEPIFFFSFDVSALPTAGYSAFGFHQNGYIAQSFTPNRSKIRC